MMRLAVILIVALGLGGCDRKPKDPQQVEF
jgi:hypothetical protein